MKIRIPAPAHIENYAVYYKNGIEFMCKNSWGYGEIDECVFSFFENMYKAIKVEDKLPKTIAMSHRKYNEIRDKKPIGRPRKEK